MYYVGQNEIDLFYSLYFQAISSNFMSFNIQYTNHMQYAEIPIEKIKETFFITFYNYCDY